MQFVSDPAISTKIDRMKERVQWQHPLIVERGIDQTFLVLDDGQSDKTEFSFFVIGDSGTGYHRGGHPQRQVAEQMLTHGQECSFVLHTGDVVYLVGSSEQYQENFIRPYREYLVGGQQPEDIAYDRMIFQQPILPVPGNHDYYDLPWIYGMLAQTASPLRRLFRNQVDLDVGWHGSYQGDAYARAFLDYLRGMKPAQLSAHLDRHYTAPCAAGRCLRYLPGVFTRLPNRYYAFRYGGIDFFALDSNTFNAPLPLPATLEGEERRSQLQAQRAEFAQLKQQLLNRVATANPSQIDEIEQLDDLYGKVEQIDEEIRDIDKQLSADGRIVIDFEQLNWLRRRLIESWRTGSVRGRILYFHHPPYVTEATKWDQGQTLAIRQHLRRVFDEVQQTIGGGIGDRPLVDLVLCGHAHCLDFLQTADTGHADSYINWIVCGGSGFSLRRQRPEGAMLREKVNGAQRTVAASHLFVGRHGRGSKKRRPYSCLRVDVQAGNPLQLVIRPFVAEKYRGQWINKSLKPFVVKSVKTSKPTELTPVQEP